ncbi:MAG: hypothetical protein LQ348_001963 [Seirophora lacunosa]|nr:MAG: hypothetical protein LQ348_001963 [Seirophora lacunosa]
MSSTKPFTVKHFADCKPSSSSSLRSLAHCHQPSAASSTETVVYYPQPQKENVRAPSKSASRFINTNAPGGPRTVTVQSGIPLLLGFPTTDLCVTEFDTSITQKPHWSLPDHITQVLDHQKKRHGEPKPKEANFELQAKNRNRVFDPEHGKIYTHCNECDPNGGPTDCQHPKDPAGYSTRLNPIRPDDPGFAHLYDPLPAPTTPKATSPSDKLITKASPSKATVTQKGDLRLTLSPPGGVDKAVKYLEGFSNLNCSKGKQAEYPDEMLAARHLSNFLTDNVEEGVATNYIVFSTHGTLLGYSSPLKVKDARNIAALAGITWRAHDQALLRGGPVAPLVSGATLLKTIAVTKAEKGPGLYNMICAHNGLLLAIQWIKGGFLAAAMIEATVADYIYDEENTPEGAGGLEMSARTTKQHGSDDDEVVWEDEEAVEDEEEEEEAEEVAASDFEGGSDGKAKPKTKARSKDPAKQTRLFEKSQGMAEAMREQWKVDDFKMPRGFR